ncbi:MAG: single-stranded-DNA-specific exonuclease RecJ [Candidatus Kerfeldbacteria bacterium]|nr:single-stranded-DNA-specific exonuclease RecJ [Candidatus Kerfeldbacteria bacterium]
MKTWIEKPVLEPEIASRFPEMNPFVLRMLWNRGMQSQDAMDTFLSPDYARDIHDPWLFSQMKQAVDRITNAIHASERITIHGDYDADGVCASAILSLTLEKLGADVHVFLPDREKDGYGLNANTVATLASDGTKLIITCDCGISNKPEIEKAAELGMDVIVTDHHAQPLELPDAAIAIIHPGVKGERYPFSGLAGGAVAWKLAHALIMNDQGKHFSPGFEKWLLDLASISTVADCMTLTGENRTIVKFGLLVMAKTRWLGLRELLHMCRLDPTKLRAEDIAFRVAPRINAAGRMDHSNTALQLLLSQRPSDAVQFAVNIERNNTERGTATETMIAEVLEQTGLQVDEQILIAVGDHWRVGLLGLVAGRVMEQFRKPVLVITKTANGFTGSCRSIPGFHLVEALQSADQMLLKYGGHAPAAGFSIAEEKLEEFLAHMRKRARELLGSGIPEQTLEIEAEIPLSAVDWNLSDALTKFEPFGAGNPEPIVATRGVEIMQAMAVGSTGKHGKFVFRSGEKFLPAIGFGFGELANQLSVGDVVDIAYAIQVNEWNGNRELQGVLKDLKHA